MPTDISVIGKYLDADTFSTIFVTLFLLLAALCALVAGQRGASENLTDTQLSAKEIIE